MIPEPEVVPDVDVPQWTRLHPITVLRELAGLAWNLIIVLVFSQSFDGPLGGALDIFLPVAVVGFGVVRYWSTAYAVTPQAVMFRRGVLVRRRTELPRDRIQNVNVGADLFGRIFSMQTVTVSSAGSEGEIQLAVVTAEEAERLVNEIMGERATSIMVTPPFATPPSNAPPSASPVSSAPPLGGPPPSTPPLVGPPLSGAPLSAPPLSMPPPGSPPPSGPPVSSAPAPASMFDGVPAPVPGTAFVVEPEPRYRMELRPFLLYAATSTPALVGATVAIVATVGGLFSGNPAAATTAIALAVPLFLVLELFEFRLDIEPDGLRVRHGLISDRRAWARRERIQIVEVRRPWLRRRLGYETVAAATADVTESESRRFDLCAPMLPADTWMELVPDLIEPVAVAESDLRAVSRRSVRRRWIRAMAPVVLVAAMVSVLFVLGGQPWWIAGSLGVVVVIGLLSWAAAHRSWRMDGWVCSPDHVLVRRGLFGTTLQLARLGKIQNVELRASFFQRRLGLASIAIDTANLGPTIELPDLERPDAEALLDDLVRVANRTVLPDGV